MIFSSFCEAKEKASLDVYIEGFETTHNIFKKIASNDQTTFHITSYLTQLKLRKDAGELPISLKYDLWRHYLDCHHLCQVLYHQTYNLPEELPIFALLEDAFPGFKKASLGEGGIWINRGFDFLETVDPHKDTKQKALNQKMQNNTQ